MSYIEAKAKYAALGVDTDAAIAKLKTIPVALHCWQGDDVGGFDQKEKSLTGGIQTTGNYPGKARTPEELMSDIDQVIALVPGQVKMNLHASYAIFDETNGGWVDRDRIEPKHFKKWVDYCKEIVRCDGLDRVFIALDYFDASINRISAWVTDFRNLQKALLFAMLQPNAELKRLQDKGNFSKLMVMQEEMKTTPFGDVWEEDCKVCGKPADGEWYPQIEKYEAEVLSKRG